MLRATKVAPIAWRTAITAAIAVALLTTAAIGLTSHSAAAARPGVERKRAEAQLVLGQIQQLDLRVERAAEAYNLATIRLDETATAIRANAHDVTIARSNLQRAQQLLSAHVVTLYTSDDGTSGHEGLLGGDNIGELIDRLDAQERISKQDRVLVQQVKVFRRTMLKRQANLADARTLQRREVARQSAQRGVIEGQLGERRRLLSTIKDEITRLEAAERARQLRLQRLLEARLEEQRRETARRATVEAATRQAVETAALKAAGDAPPPPPAAPRPESQLGIVADTPDGPAAIPAARFSAVIEIASRYLGVPYVWGGASPSGFDCSGFILYVYAQVGVTLPHHAATQYQYGSPIAKAALEPGDLVFFDDLGHNGIYIGGGQFIHAPHTGDVVKISSLSESWYTANWVGARRL